MSSAFAIAAFSTAVMSAPLSLYAGTSAADSIPTICVGPMPSQPHFTPRRRSRLLPTLSIGLDYQPRTDVMAQTRDDHLPARRVSMAPEDGRHQYDDHTMTRWTLSLRWTSRSRPDLPLSAAQSGRHTHSCRRLIVIAAQQPADLPAAVDHQIELDLHRALLHHHGRREVRND